MQKLADPFSKRMIRLRKRTIDQSVYCHIYPKILRNNFSIKLMGKAINKVMNTQCCLLYLVKKWRKFLDKNGKCGVLHTDLSKVSDCLVHDLLIAKLHDPELYNIDLNDLFLFLILDIANFADYNSPFTTAILL